MFSFNMPVSSTADDARDSDDDSPVNEPSEVIPGRLFIGDRFAASEANLRRRGFTHVLCCVSGPARIPMEGITRVILPLSDHGVSDLMDEVLPLAVPFIADSLADEGTRVLVHCSQGINRSVTVTVAYLMAAEGKSLKEAWAQVSAARPQACMHDKYVEQLRSYDLQRFGRYSTEAGEIITTSIALKRVMAAYKDS